jgi:Kdo2-lipid IVA lauroyltransferase/acyltransferase
LGPKAEIRSSCVDQDDGFPKCFPGIGYLQNNKPTVSIQALILSMKKIVKAVFVKIIFFLSRLPFGILYLISDVLFFVMSYMIRYRLRVIRHNLHLAFPGRPAAFYKRTARRFHRHFADIFIESLKNLSGNPAAITNNIRIVNPELLQHFFDKQKSIILYAGHIGNWEWLTILPKYAPHKVVALYQPLSNALFDQLIKDSREKYGIITTPSSRAFKTLKTLNDGGTLTLTIALGDQSPPPNGPKVWVDFFGQETAFIPGTNKIAQRLKQAMIYPHFSKPGRGHYEIEFMTIHDGSEAITDKQIIERYANLLEENIRQQTHLWLWSHRRWKLSAQGKAPEST